MSREENVSSGAGDKKEGGYERRCQPLYFRSESITMNCFWYPQESGGPPGRGKERRRDEKKR